jgi:signal transduction histidine kinase
MPKRTRDAIAALIAALTFGLGLASLLFSRVDPGVQIGLANGRYVVQWVNPGGQAQRDGVLPGMVVVSLNGVPLLDLPHYVYPEPQSFDPDGNPIAVEPQTVPVSPTPVGISDEAFATLVSGGIHYFEAIQPWDLERGSPDNWNVAGFTYDNSEIAATGFPFAAGVMLFVAGLWWLASGRGGTGLQTLAVPLSTAVAAPFLLRPLEATRWAPAPAVVSFLLAVAMLPLTEGLIRFVEDEGERRLFAIAAVVLAGVAVAVGLAAMGAGPDGARDPVLRWATIGAIPLLPGIAAARPMGFTRLPTPASSGKLLESAEFAVAGATPAFALATDRDATLFPLSVWFIGVALAGRLTIRPLARLATRAQIQRDLIVAATEAERARVAADIHDDALQELTLLVRRLDSAGDAEGADIARQVSDRLRAICGDLRLPILDDLGVGPALDWLVLRIERLAGGEVRLERADGSRPPPDVELAFFRIAQEALSNAVKHGRPPIIVRYRSTDAGASLSVDDAGPGIQRDAGDVAQQAGHFGLLNMEQRAQQIGAILDVRRWPSGGTHVALEWRPR